MGALQNLRVQGKVIPFGVIKEQRASDFQRAVNVAPRQTL